MILLLVCVIAAAGATIGAGWLFATVLPFSPGFSIPFFGLLAMLLYGLCWILSGRLQNRRGK